MWRVKMVTKFKNSFFPDLIYWNDIEIHLGFQHSYLVPPPIWSLACHFQCRQACVWWLKKEPGCGNWQWFGHCTWLPDEKKKPSRVSSLPTVSCSTVFDWSALLQDNCAKHNEKWSWMRYFDWYCILLKTGSILLKSDFLLGWPSLWPLHWIYWSGHTFSRLVLCDFHTAKWCRE